MYFLFKIEIFNLLLIEFVWGWSNLHIHTGIDQLGKGAPLTQMPTGWDIFDNDSYQHNISLHLTHILIRHPPLKVNESLRLLSTKLNCNDEYIN